MSLTILRAYSFLPRVKKKEMYCSTSARVCIYDGLKTTVAQNQSNSSHIFAAATAEALSASA